MKIIETRSTELSPFSTTCLITQRKRIGRTCPAGVARPRHEIRPTETLELLRTVLLAHSDRIADIAEFSTDLFQDLIVEERPFVLSSRKRAAEKEGRRPPRPLMAFDYVYVPI